MASEEDIAIFREVVKNGGCYRCAVRFTAVKDFMFDDIETAVITGGYVEPSELFFEPLKKKPKTLGCMVCLGALEDNFLEEVINHDGLDKTKEYQSPTFLLNISVPSSVMIRNHSMELYLSDKFPQRFRRKEILPVPKACRYALQDMLVKKLNKKYHPQSRLIVKIYAGYKLEKEESIVVSKFCCPNNKKKFLSKHHIEASLDHIKESDFRRWAQVPPKKSLERVYVEKIECESRTVQLYGTFCKYDRNLLTTNEENSTATIPSVENIICDAVTKTLGLSKHNYYFGIVTKEAKSVRILGPGWPFYVYINDFKGLYLSDELCETIKKEVCLSKVVSVTNLCEYDSKRQLMQLYREVLSKARVFKVLCMIENCTDLQQCIDKINSLTMIHVVQRTPVRVLAHRPPVVKTRTIYSIKATAVEGTDSWMEVDLWFASGLIIQEFFDGDLGRTKPSLRSILGKNVEVLAMDFLRFEMPDSQLNIRQLQDSTDDEDSDI